MDTQSETIMAGFMPTRDQWERSQAAVRALTAQLAAVTEERNQWRRVCLAQDRIGIKRALSARKVARAYRQLDAEASEWMLKAMKQAAETGAARLEAERWKNAAMGENVKHALAIDEVARLRELIERKAGALTVFSQHTGLSTGMCIQWRHEFDAALRGDTAPAQSAKSAMDDPAATVTAKTIKWEGGRP